MNAKFWLGVILFALAALFLLQNMDVIEMRFLFWSFSIPGSLLLFITLVLGMVIGSLWHSLSLHRRKKQADSSSRPGTPSS